MNISTFYKLGKTQTELEFVDVRLDTDNLLFVDPRLIESITGNSLVSIMQSSIEAYWGELIKSVKAKDSVMMKSLLSGLSEPNETRLGYSHSKRSGNSVGNKLKPKIITAITTNKAVKTGILSHFADLELFIPDINCDRISDITTKIIKAQLIEFTQIQAKKLGIKLYPTVQKDIFNYTTFKWETQKVELPLDDDDKAVIFVPKELVRLENSANSNINCFYRYAIRKFIKYDLDMLKGIQGSGKDQEIQLCDIKNQYPLSKQELTNWSMKYGKLLVDYKTDHLNGRLRSLTDEEIERIVYNLPKAS